MKQSPQPGALPGAWGAGESSGGTYLRLGSPWLRCTAWPRSHVVLRWFYRVALTLGHTVRYWPSEASPPLSRETCGRTTLAGSCWHAFSPRMAPESVSRQRGLRMWTPTKMHKMKDPLKWEELDAQPPKPTRPSQSISEKVYGHCCFRSSVNPCHKLITDQWTLEKIWSFSIICKWNKTKKNSNHTRSLLPPQVRY